MIWIIKIENSIGNIRSIKFKSKHQFILTYHVDYKIYNKKFLNTKSLLQVKPEEDE